MFNVECSMLTVKWPAKNHSFFHSTFNIQHCAFNIPLFLICGRVGDSIRSAPRRISMRKKRIALVFGMEDTFPWALIDAINTRGGDQVEAMPAEISYLKDDGVFPYDLILDRISHEIPFYRTYLK